MDQTPTCAQTVCSSHAREVRNTNDSLSQWRIQSQWRTWHKVLRPPDNHHSSDGGAAGKGARDKALLWLEY